MSTWNPRFGSYTHQHGSTLRRRCDVECAATIDQSAVDWLDRASSSSSSRGSAWLQSLAVHESPQNHHRTGHAPINSLGGRRYLSPHVHSVSASRTSPYRPNTLKCLIDCYCLRLLLLLHFHSPSSLNGHHYYVPSFRDAIKGSIQINQSGSVTVRLGYRLSSP